MPRAPELPPEQTDPSSFVLGAAIVAVVAVSFGFVLGAVFGAVTW